MAEDPIPVVVCSALTGAGTDARAAGARGGRGRVVTKPQLGVREFLDESAVRLHRRRARRPREARVGQAPPDRLAAPDGRRRPAAAPGTGRRACRRTASSRSARPPAAPRRCASCCRRCRRTRPGIVVVQHMPEGFTAAFADAARRPVPHRGEGGRRRRPRARRAARSSRRATATCSCAGAATHYAVERRGRPARLAPPAERRRALPLGRAGGGPNAVGVLLTGMGDDGAQGLLEMQRSGRRDARPGRGDVRRLRHAAGGHRARRGGRGRPARRARPRRS